MQPNLILDSPCTATTYLFSVYDVLLSEWLGSSSEPGRCCQSSSTLQKVDTSKLRTFIAPKLCVCKLRNRRLPDILTDLTDLNDNLILVCVLTLFAAREFQACQSVESKNLGDWDYRWVCVTPMKSLVSHIYLGRCSLTSQTHFTKREGRV